MATSKQVNYALALLSENGFDTRYMDASFKKLGARMRQRSGTVQGWIEGMSTHEASQLITTLKEGDF